ncbi:hypothetical protein EXW72_10570 [Pseudomonas sp. BCA14]|nr:hypothetical protein EXW70_12070 [Pseudomonas sp. JMN1]TFF11906.1 hypothetical protein EXW71_09820 [Pseudomonas sp. BCA17]TFF28682.1 hypothetical protein EXW72_10570 [Pseudomonas sp. BCA14]
MNDAASRARQGGRRALGAPLIKKCAILATGNALDQLYTGKYDECCIGRIRTALTMLLSPCVLLCAVCNNFRHAHT